MKNNFIFSFLVFLICIGGSLFAQQEEITTTKQASNTDASLGASSVEAAQNIMLARSSADYRVTAGDVYTLAYAAGGTPVSYIIAVDSSYRIRVSNLGIINGAGKTFVQLKNEVETIVANNYPLSGVQLVLTQPAMFRVHIKGEVGAAGEVPAWALSRLSSLAGGNLTAYASTRDIAIKSLNGQTRIYDLFKAWRFGDASQDPYLRPGDIITFNKISRLVTVAGAVERPGAYQLLEGENIKELIELYGSGFTPVADRTRLEMTRMVNSVDISGDKIFLSEIDLTSNYALENYDLITVPDITKLQPVMFVEGAVARTAQSLQTITTTAAADDLVASNRLVVPFSRGETYASIVRRNIEWFTAVSDTQRAYIIRGNEQLPINLNPMLYDAQYRGEVLVQENDILIIPFRQYFVTVAGAVANPGRYPYIPDRDWEYYIGLAGGFMAGRNAFDQVTITEISGRRIKKTDAIVPETVITASTNHALYYFNQYAPVLTTILTVVSTIFSVQAYVNSR
jgi:protein involved in polysaccharide export with SLBB domain